MNYQEVTIQTEPIFEGRVIRVRRDTVRLPNGHTSTRELVSHHGGVCVLPLDADGNVYLVRQYRKATECMLLEVPAGKLEPGEGHFICGERELWEETGCSARLFHYLGFFYPSPGYVNEKIHMYLATGLEQGELHLDQDEFLDVVKLPFEEVLRRVKNNEIHDGKTIVAVLKAKEYLEGEKWL